MIIKRNKEEILEEFKEKYVNNHWIQDFIDIDEFYRNNKEAIDKELNSKFNSICEKCIKMQKDSLKGEIKYIYFSFLRTSFIKRKGEFRIDFYDENWFLDKYECTCNMKLDFMYTNLFAFMDYLKKKKKEYLRDLSDMDIENIILDEADKYMILSIEFFKEIIKKFFQLPAYILMNKSKDIKIMAGEYMDQCEIIYEENLEQNIN